VNIKKLSESSKSNAKEEAIAFLKSKNIDTTNLVDKDFKEISKELDNYYNKYKTQNLQDMLIGLHNKFGIDIDNINIKEIGAILGAAFLHTALVSAIWAAILVIIVIFIIFREWVPSLAVISAGIIDVFGALLGMAIFNIPLSLTTIPVLLMLVGYSVDTDIMLTTKLLKRKEGGSPNKRVVDAMKTGLIMTSTTLGAMLSMLVVSYVYNITDIFYMAIVLICGLIVDLLSTWLMNAPVLLWYVESKKK